MMEANDSTIFPTSTPPSGQIVKYLVRKNMTDSDKRGVGDKVGEGKTTLSDIRDNKEENKLKLKLCQAQVQLTPPKNS